MLYTVTTADNLKLVMVQVGKRQPASKRASAVAEPFMEGDEGAAVPGPCSVGPHHD
jgi:hypothetical protein